MKSKNYQSWKDLWGQLSSPDFHFIYFLAVLCGVQDLSSPTRNGTRTPAVELQSPNSWTAKEFPDFHFKNGKNKAKGKEIRGLEQS